MGLINKTDEQYYLGNDGQWNSGDENYGNYQFTSVKDIINNFMIIYVGEEKIISKVKRTEVAFHAQRAIQEFSFDLLPSTKTQEIEIGPSLNFILPKDYVNYVKLTWTDGSGNERIIYPASKTRNPKSILQDNNYQYLFDQQSGAVTESEESVTKERFQQTTPDNNNDLNIEGIDQQLHFGQRYGGEPSGMQTNGLFYINNTEGIVYFDSSMANRIVTLQYISDGLGSDEDMVVHKFAEEAVYKYIIHAVLSNRANTQEYIVSRFKREAAADRRNAKIRLSNIKIEEIAQIMRNKSKRIKH